ncbi:hypothetical protein [Acidilobus sp.]|uniref:hypothetical protein n=1 Tax=Acidilobus sp. TaxID=1872109 RepID=UPI003D09477F
MFDWGSGDGTYERLLEIVKDYNMRVYRLPGSSCGGRGTTRSGGARGLLHGLLRP